MDPIELIHPRSLRYLSDQLQSLVRGRLWLQVVIGMLLGIALGVAMGPGTGWVSTTTATTVGNWVALPGRVFLSAIQMVVIPLVFASIIRGLAASENMDELRRTGLRAAVFFIVTTTCAIVIGIGLAHLIEPGRFLDPALARRALDPAQLAAVPGDAQGLGAASLPQALVGVIPENPLGAMVQGEMLGVVLFAIIMGVALVSMPPEQSQPLLALLGSLQQVSMTIVRWAMWLAPFAVFGLIAQLTSTLGLRALLGMSIYVATVIGGLALLLVVYVALAWALAGKTPGEFLGAVRGVQLLAFSTSSSAAVMPLSIETAEERLGVRPSVSQFVIPLGATINMNGTALYQGVATLFLAQVFGLELTTGQLALVVVTAVAASVGSPATPGVGIVILALVLRSAGVPVAGIGLIIGVDRILDMCRTAVNVTGDILAATVLDRFLVSGSTAEAQRERERSLELERQRTSRDVIVAGTAAPD